MNSCLGCLRPVKRNRVSWKGEIWHKACAETDGRMGPPVAHCQDCGRELGHGDITKAFFVHSKPLLSCAICGSQELIWGQFEQIENLK